MITSFYEETRTFNTESQIYRHGKAIHLWYLLYLPQPYDTKMQTKQRMYGANFLNNEKGQSMTCIPERETKWYHLAWRYWPTAHDEHETCCMFILINEFYHTEIRERVSINKKRQHLILLRLWVYGIIKVMKIITWHICRTLSWTYFAKEKKKRKKKNKCDYIFFAGCSYYR